jgi:triacylglycerol lipase
MRRALAIAFVVTVAVAPPASGAVNDFGCKPSAQRPVPIVILHGTFGDSQSLLGPMRTLLDGRGYCVFVPDYGNRATAPSEESAEEIAEFARRVLEATHARRISFVGHSQGGMLGRYVAKSRGLLDRVDDVVGFAPSSHGTDQPLAPPLGMTVCPSCGDQATGSEFMQKVNAGEEAPGPTTYTVLSTQYDTVVIPVESQALAGPPERVTNVLLQDRCPGDTYEHVSIPLDPVALQWMVNALERPGPANPRFEPDCSGETLGRDPDPVPASPTGGQTADTRALLRGRVARRVRAGLAVPVRCEGPAGARCNVRLRVSVSRRTLGSRRASVRAGRTTRVRVRLAARARRALSRARRVRVTLREPRNTQRRTYVVRG